MLVATVVSVLLGFIDCTQPLLGVALLTIGFGMIGCVVGSGFIVNLNDIGGKHYSGVLFGISNTFGTIPGIIAPYFVGLMTPHVIKIKIKKWFLASFNIPYQKGTAEEWRLVFIVTAVFYLIGGIPYIFLAKGEVEKWAILESTKQNDKSFEFS